MATLTRQGKLWVPPEVPCSPYVRDGLQPRVIYFPPSIIEEHDREPGQLIELVTLAIASYLDGKAVPA